MHWPDLLEVAQCGLPQSLGALCGQQPPTKEPLDKGTVVAETMMNVVCVRDCILEVPTFRLDCVTLKNDGIIILDQLGSILALWAVYL